MQGSVWGRAMHVHLLPVVVRMRYIVTCAWRIHTVRVVLCVGLRLEKLRLLELTCHWWLQVAVCSCHLFAIVYPVHTESLTARFVELLEEMLMHFLLSVEHLAWEVHAWGHSLRASDTATVDVLVLNELVVLALHRRVEALVGPACRAQSNCGCPAFCVRAQLRRYVVTRVPRLH